MFNQIGKMLGPFYFSIGGIGDLFLSLASFYDKMQDQDASFLFWASNPKIIKCILTKENFPKLNKILITQNFLGTQMLQQYYTQVSSQKEYLGSTHIPSGLRYVDEWSKIDNVFEWYKIPRVFEWLKTKFYDETYKDNIVWQPLSSSNNDPHKEKDMSQKSIEDFLDRYENSNLILTGSEDEIEHIRYKYRYLGRAIDGITESIKAAVSCKEVYSTDSWVKTVSGLCGIPTTIYYYKRKNLPQQFFGNNIQCDPADNVFLKNWGFNIIDQYNYGINL